MRNQHHQRVRLAVLSIVMLGLGLVMIGPIVGLASAARAAPAQIDERESTAVRYEPPVNAPIIDPFRPPESFAGPGNRGLEYGVTAGTEVRAAADGVVAFAGQVGGSQYITIAHADGVETTYSYLAEVLVSQGQAVALGQVIGVTSDVFHFGARVGGAYIDPATLFAASAPDGASVLGARPIRSGKAILLPTNG